ncbi:MAG: class I SAM-dependent methyltransferase [Candidatus Eisenbacteria bacterium]|nr:class I SAM-dependent methyltransferase [Candidatus Eisenbacteria bacterium]
MRRSDWNAYWSRSEGGRFTRESWSKRRIMERLDPYLRPGMRVLDAGCGCGHFCRRFLFRGCRVTALDRSEEALRIARRATGGEAEAYLREDLLDEGFAARRRESFDLIFSDGLLEHFPAQAQRKIVANLVAALAPGGMIATFVPNALSPWRVVRPFLMPGIHETPFRGGPLRELHAGLDVLEAGGVNVLPFRWSPERALGGRFGMLLYVLARRRDGGS